MKLHLIIIIFISSCGYGQYPDTRYKGNDSPHADTFVNNKFYSSEGDTLFFYWSRYLFYSHESDKQKDIIKKSKSRKPPQWVINLNNKEYDRLMDSVVRYKKLIDKLNK